MRPKPKIRVKVTVTQSTAEIDIAANARDKDPRIVRIIFDTMYSHMDTTKWIVIVTRLPRSRDDMFDLPI